MLEQRARRGVPARSRRASGPVASSSSCAAGRAKQSATAAPSRASRRRSAGSARCAVTTPSSASPAAIAPWIARARLEHPSPEDGIARAADHAVGDLRVVEHRPATARAPDDVDAVARARLEVHVAERLHASEAQTRRTESVETHGTGGRPPCALVEQRHVAAHVLLPRGRRIDDEREPGSGGDGRDLRH